MISHPKPWSSSKPGYFFQKCPGRVSITAQNRVYSWLTERLQGLNGRDRSFIRLEAAWLGRHAPSCTIFAQSRQRLQKIAPSKEHPTGTTGSESVDHIAFPAADPRGMRERIRAGGVEMHYRSLLDAKLFQIFLKDPDGGTIELSFFGEIIESEEWHEEAIV